MTVATIGDVLDEVFGLIVAFIGAIGVYVAAFVGLIVLAYLIKILGKGTTDVRKMLK